MYLAAYFTLYFIVTDLIANMYARDVSEMPGEGSAGDLPQWYMPPRMIGGHVSGPVLVHRSEGLVVAIRQILAYPIGFEVEIEAHARGSSPGGPPPDPGGLGGHAEPSFRFRLADGTEVQLDDDTGLRTGLGPMLVVSKGERSSGGPDSREDVRLGLWMWPLPPPGPLTVVCSWPRRGLQDTGIVLDADAIRTAAFQAQPFWPAAS